MSLDRALDRLVGLQRERGDWEGEVVWCTMLLSQYVIACRIIGRDFDASERAGIAQHYRTTQRDDGSWGLHPESRGYVFTTTLAYVALRLLGLPPDDPLLAPALRWLRAQPGGVLAIPTWGKFWLALIGLYEYAGVNPCPPELFIAPRWLPFHPSRFYCHTRHIYLGIAYLYGSRFRADLGPITTELRRELYADPYERIDFAAHRHDLAATDVYVRPSLWLRLAYDALALYELLPAASLRRRALAYCFDRILYEQRVSRYQAISPVNGLLNCLAIWSRDPRHPDFAPSFDGVESWRWSDEAGGVRFAGARSNAWDTAFAMQAIAEAPDAARHARALRAGFAFLRDTQVLAEHPDYGTEHRDPALGGWCFSDGRHLWPVSDCTAEAVCALLLVPDERLSDERMRLAAEFILSRQNDDGGFGTYERRRGSLWLDRVNPSEMYGACMTERSYIECTGSSIRALARLRGVAGLRVDDAIARGVAFLRRQQQPDGSFAGFWGINYTYATMFVVKGLRAAGVERSDAALTRAAAWLISKQRADGGWGEHYSSCLEQRYVEHSESQVTMTSWALLALMQIVPADAEPVTRGVAWLRARQNPDGSWPRQAVNGVFFGAAMLDYRLYEVYFPAWALARYAALTSAP